MIFSIIAGAVGIEPTLTVLETAVLPLNYAPKYILCNSALADEDYNIIPIHKMQALFL